jgi:hypothetical protein
MEEGMDNEKFRAVIEEASVTLRALASERTKLASKVREYERRDEAKAIVSELEKRGYSDPGVSIEDRIDALLNSGKDLAVVKEAMSLATSNLPFASVAQDRNSLSGTSPFENFILTGE